MYEDLDLALALETPFDQSPEMAIRGNTNEDSSKNQRVD